MALNCSHRPIIPAHTSEDNVVQDGFREKDIGEILPDDPFGMDISSTVTAITGWLEDLGVSDYGGGCVGDVSVSKGNYSILAESSFWWDAAREITPFRVCEEVDGTVSGDDRFHDFIDGEAFGCCIDEDSVFGCSIDEDGVSRDSCFMGDLIFGCGDNSVHGEDIGFGCNKSNDAMVRTNEFDGFVAEEAIKHFVDEDGASRGCFMEDVIFGCGIASVHGNEIGLGVKNNDDEMYTANSSIGGFVAEEALGRFVEHGDVHQGCVSLEEELLFDCGLTSVFKWGKMLEVSGDFADLRDGSLHPALNFALAYLGVRDLLAVERVCKSLQFTIRNDPLLWKSIHIDFPLSMRVTDDILLKLTSRAQGHLKCLSLVKCMHITDDGLKRILESNPRLIKLSVPGCTKLSYHGVVSSLRAFQMNAMTGIKSLRVDGLCLGKETLDSVEHLKRFEELRSLLGTRNHVQQNHLKPQFYHVGSSSLSYEDDRPLDVEICPRCHKLKLVYDCPDESCQSSDHTQAAQSCKACFDCIRRCVYCGRCVEDVVYEENFFKQFCCCNCCKQELKYQQWSDLVSSPSEYVIPHELYG